MIIRDIDATGVLPKYQSQAIKTARTAIRKRSVVSGQVNPVRPDSAPSFLYDIPSRSTLGNPVTPEHGDPAEDGLLDAPPRAPKTPDPLNAMAPLAPPEPDGLRPPLPGSVEARDAEIVG